MSGALGSSSLGRLADQHAQQDLSRHITACQWSNESASAHKERLHEIKPSQARPVKAHYILPYCVACQVQVCTTEAQVEETI